MSIIINEIDNRLKTEEYKNFKATANRLIQIRKKLLHKEKLTESDIRTLKAENFSLNN